MLYSGKANSLGLKSGGSGGRWAELAIPKGPRAQHIAVGHEGLHAVIVTEDGSAFFCGTARRGEDGDISEFTLHCIRKFISRVILKYIRFS